MWHVWEEKRNAHNVSVEKMREKRNLVDANIERSLL